MTQNTYTMSNSTDLNSFNLVQILVIILESYFKRTLIKKNPLK